MFDDLREQLSDDPFSDKGNEKPAAAPGAGDAATTPFLFVDDDQIDGVLREYEKTDRFEGYGIYEEDAPQAEDEPADEVRILGMNAPQRFMLSVMIFIMVVVLGGFCLLLAGKIVLPFF